MRNNLWNNLMIIPLKNLVNKFKLKKRKDKKEKNKKEQNHYKCK